MRNLLLSAIGVLASLAFIGASMTMNYLYGIGLGRNALEAQIWGAVSIASDALKALSPIFLFWAWRNQQWGTALVSVLLLLVTMGYALQSAAGFASESRSVLVGGRESARSTYLEIENELESVRRRRAAMNVARSVAEVEASIAATLSRVVKDGERVRGTVGTVSMNCARAEARTADACLEVGKLRQELAATAEAARLDERIEVLHEQARELRDKGASADPHPQATLLSWLTFGRWTPGDIEAGKSIYLALLVELGSLFGLLISVEHGELRKAWDAGSNTRWWRAPNPAAARHSPPSLAAAGDVDGFIQSCLQRRKGSELEVGDLYGGYRTWCDRTGLRALSVESFAETFAVICERVGLRTHPRGTKVFCLDVQLARDAGTGCPGE